MQLVRKLHIPALLCSLAVLLCALISRPYASMGVCDDGPYILMTRTLAATGHIAYNGWATAMVGWQLYLGALFIRIFGFSFTTVRMSALSIAVLVAFLLQRTLVLAGIRERNAAIATLTLVLSPLYLMMSATFMTDITGLFAVVLCLYGCLRALRASTSSSTIGWLCFAVAANALFGTSRQIAWLGTLVMVPSTLWLLRAQRRVLLSGCAAVLSGALFIFACMQWFKHQPYTIPEHLFVKSLPPAHTVAAVAYLFADIPFLLFPLAAIFLFEIRPLGVRQTRPFALALIAACSIGYLLLALHWRHRHPNLLLEPTMRDWVNIFGIFEGSSLPGNPPIFLNRATQMVTTIVCFGGLMGLLGTLLSSRPEAVPATPASAVSWRQLRVLLLPFTCAYTALLVPRAAQSVLYDRYVFALLVVALIFLVRFYQQRVQPQLPLISFVLVALVAIYAVAMTHNNFAFYRARAALAAELRSAGVPDTHVDNGWEYNSAVEIKQAGHINDPAILNPPNSYIAVPPTPPAVCVMHGYYAIPHIHPLYGISFDPQACAGPAPFAPVRYSRWLASAPGALYVVRYTPASKP